MWINRLLGTLLVLTLPAVALAQPDPNQPPPPPGPAPSEPAPPPEVVPAPPAPAPVAPMPVAPMPPGVGPVAPVQAPPAPLAEAGVLADANIGRTYLAPTALMSPKGSWTFSDWELFFIGGSYAFTDNLSLSAVTLIPVSNNQPFIGMFTAKARVIRQPRFHLAAHASLGIVADDGDNANALTLGGVATYCTSPDCASNLSGFVGGGFAYEDQSAVPLMLSGSLVQKLGKRIKLVLEVDTGAVLGEIDAVADGFLFWYGLRFTSANLGVDLGLVKPIYDGSGDDELLPLGYPLVSFTYRGLPSD